MARDMDGTPDERRELAFEDGRVKPVKDLDDEEFKDRAMAVRDPDSPDPDEDEDDEE